MFKGLCDFRKQQRHRKLDSLMSKHGESQCTVHISSCLLTDTHTHTHTRTHTQSSTITHAVNHCKLHCRKLTRYTQYACYCKPPGALKGVLRYVLFPEYAVSLYLLPVVSLHLSLRFCLFVSLHLLSASTHLSVSSCLLPFLVVFMLFLSLLGSPWDISLYHSLCVFHHPSFLYF